MRRETLSLDGVWDFHFCGDARIPLDLVPAWRRCAVPNQWQAEFADLRDRNGHAWYLRQVTVPAAWLDAPGKRTTGKRAVFLRFGAVAYLARVQVNGRLVQEHEGGWLPFEADITAALAPGANEIAVEVLAPDGNAAASPETPVAEIPFGKQSWYGPLGGLWQSVTLECRAAVHVTGLALRPDLDGGSLTVTVALSRPPGIGGRLEVTVTDPDGRPVASAALPAEGADRVGTTLAVTDPRPWSPADPALYRVTARLETPAGIEDEACDTTGFRTIATADGRILLNGRPLFLRAALDQDYYPDGICTAPSEAFLEDQFRKARQLGLNCLRCHIKVPDPRYYAVADRVGLLIWTELPNTGILTARAAERALETLHGIVERDGNHPSIICWTVINENWGTDLVHDARHRDWVRRTRRWLKALDPSRLVVDNSPLAPSFHVESDLDDMHFYAGIPDHRRAWDGFIADLATRPAWTYSPHGDARRGGREPLLCSEFGNWGLPDPEALRGPDGAEPWWFETGHDWGDGVMYPHGVEARFRAAGLEAVFGSLKGFVAAAQWQQFAALKYQIEVMRRTPAMAGYVITEFTDCHWESNGLLDMRRNPRAFHDVFATVNGETVVVPHWHRTAYWAGETVTVGLSVAHGGGTALDGVELRWSLATEGGVESLGRLDHGVRMARPAVFRAPGMSAPGSHRLDLELATGSGVMAINGLDLVIHPRRRGPDAGAPAVWAPDPALAERLAVLGYRLACGARDAGIIVTASLDPDLVAALREGASALLLADRPMALQPVFPHWQNVRVTSRAGSPWQGDWASSFSWLRRQGPFARLPGGPLLDHAFDRVIPDQVIAGCTSWDFQGRVHAGMVVGWVHKPAALIVERAHGRGHLVASTFRLLNDPAGADPTATALLDGLIALAARHARQPAALSAVTA